MITRDQLLKINGLKLSGKIEKMDDDRFIEYCKTLKVFVEIFPYQEGRLKSALDAKDYDSLSNILLSAGNILTLIYADDLAQKCVEFSDEVKSAKQEVVEAYLSYLLTKISMLSIDIQMVQYNDVPHAPDTIAYVKEEDYVQEEQQKSILAVDDISLNLNELKLFLQKTEYKLTCLTSGGKALEFIANHMPDLLILDIEMPEMDGYELAKKLREKGCMAPIIFLTGNSTQDYVMKAIQAGAADFITKPVNKNMVLDKIKKHI